jgi:hypothetical protein
LIESDLPKQASSDSRGDQQKEKSEFVEAACVPEARIHAIASAQVSSRSRSLKPYLRRHCQAREVAFRGRCRPLSAQGLSIFLVRLTAVVDSRPSVKANRAPAAVWLARETGREP